MTTTVIRPESADGVVGVLRGLPASPGVAIGPAFIYCPTEHAAEPAVVGSPADERARLEAGMAAAAAEVRQLRATAAARTGADEAAIFEAYLTWLDDPALHEGLVDALEAPGCAAEAAVEQAFGTYADELAAASDSYFSARAADVRALARQVLGCLSGATSRGLELSEPCIVVARDLSPADTVGLESSRVLGFCTATGAPTAHTAILARSLGIPAVVGVGEDLLSIAPGTTLGLDGESGEIMVAPTAADVTRLREERQRRLDEAQRLQQQAQAAAITSDGVRVEVVANIGSVADAAEVARFGGEGVGLLRTEFLYVDRQTLPGEMEQADQYRQIAMALGAAPLVIRTMDIGGDKPVPYLPIEPEANPFLGYRALRIGLDQPDLLKTQLRAILRIGPGHSVKIMFPMVADVGEVRRAVSLLDEARADLRRQGVAVADPIEVGIMIEIPSAAVLADQLAGVVDFFSIGTNDLTQYTLAADRANSRVAGMYDPLHPAVLRLIKQVIDAAHAHGRWVGLCGELAGDPEATPALLGLGLDEFSCATKAIPRLKARVRGLDTTACRALASAVLEQETAAAVHQVLAGFERGDVRR